MNAGNKNCGRSGLGTVKGFTISEVYVISLSARFLRLRSKKNRARRSKMRMSPPTTPPMIGVLLMVVELDDEFEELPDGTLVEVGVIGVEKNVEDGVIEVVEDGVIDIVEDGVIEAVEDVA